MDYHFRSEALGYLPRQVFRTIVAYNNLVREFAGLYDDFGY